MRSSWVRVGPKPNDMCPYERQEDSQELCDHEGRGHSDGPQAQGRLETTAAGHRRRTPPWSLWRGNKPARTLISDFWPPQLRE